MRWVIAILCLLSLSGCLSLPPAFVSYSEKDPNGMIAAWAGRDYFDDNTNPTFFLLKVEMSKVKFGKQMLIDCKSEEFECVGPRSSDLTNSNGRAYSLMTVKPGIYAVVSSSSSDYGVHRGARRYGKRRWIQCHYSALEFFEIPAGQVSTVDVGEMLKGHSVSDQAVGNLLKKHGVTGITAPIKNVKVVAKGFIENAECGEVLNGEAILTILPI